MPRQVTESDKLTNLLRYRLIYSWKMYCSDPYTLKFSDGCRNSKYTATGGSIVGRASNY